jgi:hypothetical protein
LYRATWHSTFDSFRVPQSVPFAPLIRLRFSLLLQVLPFASTAPNTGEGSDLHSQGGCQQANLLALRLSPQDVTYSCPAGRPNVFGETICCRKANPNLTRYIATFLQVSSEV